MATGFQPANYLARLPVVGREGKSLQEHWAGEPRAYLGITVPGFPNFFMLYGPGTNGGEIVTMLESQAEFAARAVKRMRRERVTAIEVKPRYRGAVEPLAPVEDAGHVVDDEQQLLQVTHRHDRHAMALGEPPLPGADQAVRPRVGDDPSSPVLIRGSDHAGQATALVSRYCSKPALPFWRPTPLCL